MRTFGDTLEEYGRRIAVTRQAVAA